MTRQPETVTRQAVLTGKKKKDEIKYPGEVAFSAG
jgi:hypothetical protein